MKLGILSDTHNNLKNLQLALDIFRERDVDILIHCGDFTQVETASALAGFRVIAVYGNGDIESGNIRAALLSQRADNYAGMEYSGVIGGARIAVTHGHIGGRVEVLTQSGQYDFVFKGHSHQHKEERIGTTRLINPGALGGLRREARHVCLLDLNSGNPEFIAVTDPSTQTGV